MLIRRWRVGFDHLRQHFEPCQLSHDLAHLVSRRGFSYYNVFDTGTHFMEHGAHFSMDSSTRQCYFSFRLYILSGSKNIASLSAALAVSRVLLYTAQVIARLVCNGGQSGSWIWSIFTGKTISILCDFLVSGHISIILIRRSKTITLGKVSFLSF